MADLCKLLVIANDKDDDGFPVEVVKESFDAYVLREKSVRLSEFYAALSTGISPRLILELRVEEWEQSGYIDDAGTKRYATKVEYDGGLYDVVRTYKTNKSCIQITLTEGRREWSR